VCCEQSILSLLRPSLRGSTSGHDGDARRVRSRALRAPPPALPSPSRGEEEVCCEQSILSHLRPILRGSASGHDGNARRVRSRALRPSPPALPSPSRGEEGVCCEQSILLQPPPLLWGSVFGAIYPLAPSSPLVGEGGVGGAPQRTNHMRTTRSPRDRGTRGAQLSPGSLPVSRKVAASSIQEMNQPGALSPGV